MLKHQSTFPYFDLELACKEICQGTGIDNEIAKKKHNKCTDAIEL